MNKVAYPTAKIMAELGVPVTNAAIAAHYEGLIDGLVLDRADQAEAAELTVPALVTETVMTNLEERIALAAAVLGFAAELDGRRKAPAQEAAG